MAMNSKWLDDDVDSIFHFRCTARHFSTFLSLIYQITMILKDELGYFEKVSTQGCDGVYYLHIISNH